MRWYYAQARLQAGQSPTMHTRDSRTYLHGCDSVTVGTGNDSKRLKGRLGQHYELKTEVLGPPAQDKQQVKGLNGITTWEVVGAEYGADPRHAELCIKEVDLEYANGVSSPGAKEEGR